jgi:hypothetical protein
MADILSIVIGLAGVILCLVTASILLKSVMRSSGDIRRSTIFIAAAFILYFLVGVLEILRLDSSSEGLPQITMVLYFASALCFLVSIRIVSKLLSIAVDKKKNA